MKSLVLGIVAITQSAYGMIMPEQSSYGLSGIPTVSNMTIAKFEDLDADTCRNIVIMRHAMDQCNRDNRAHQDNTSQDYGCIDRSNESIELCQNVQSLSEKIKDMVVFSSNTERSATTATLTNVDDARIHLHEAFREQSLGDIASSDISDIVRTPEFQEMLKNADHKPNGNGESGNEVVGRLFDGLKDVVSQSGHQQVSLVVTHRLTINWMMRYLLQETVTIPDFPNCHCIIVRFDDENRRVALWKPEECSKAKESIVSVKDFDISLCLYGNSGETRSRTMSKQITVEDITKAEERAKRLMLLSQQSRLVALSRREM